MKIVLNEDSKVGRCNELIEMNSLFAKLLIMRGKAKLPQDKGCEVDQLLWAEFGTVTKVSNSFVRNESRVVRYEAKTTKKAGLFKYICLTDNNNELCLKRIATGKVYHIDSSKNRFSGIRLNDKVIMSNSIVRFISKYPELVSDFGITANTYLTKEKICELEQIINNTNGKNINN